MSDEGLQLDPALVLNAMVQRTRAANRQHADLMSGLLEEIAQLEALITTQGQRIAALEQEGT